MKKVVFLSAIAIAVLSVKADYLYWQVPDNATTDSSYNRVALWGSTATGSDWKTTYDQSGSTWSNLSGYDVATPGKIYETELSGVTSSSAGSYQNFFIELVQYDNSTYTPVTGAYVSYDDIKSYLNAGKLSVISDLQTYTGGQYNTSNVPEPTSGLMLLMGMALVALKRKRA